MSVLSFCCDLCVFWVVLSVDSASRLTGIAILVRELIYLCNRVYCRHVPGHDPITFSFRSFSFLIGWGFYGPIIYGVKSCVLGRQRPFSPSVPAEAGCLFNCCGRCSCVFIRGEPLSSYFSMACCSVVSY